MFLFVQTRVGPILGTTGGKLIRPANFDKLIHQYEGEVGFFLSVKVIYLNLDYISDIYISIVAYNSVT